MSHQRYCHREVSLEGIDEYRRRGVVDYWFTIAAFAAAEDPWMRSNTNAKGLKSVHIRTLVVTGARDVITSPANSRSLVRQLRDATLTLVRNASHSFLFQKPDA
jgi:pimeloyl-ACP methyl ester carboxylesterase